MWSVTCIQILLSLVLILVVALQHHDFFAEEFRTKLERKEVSHAQFANPVQLQGIPESTLVVGSTIMPWRWEEGDIKTSTLLQDELESLPSKTKHNCKVAYRSKVEAEKDMVMPGQCCPGAISSGAGNSPPRGFECLPENGVDYFLKFRIRVGNEAERGPTSFANGLRLLPHGTRVVLLGDSLQNQFFSSAACALGRDPSVLALRARANVNCKSPKGWSHGVQSYQSLLVRLEENLEVELIFFRMYQPIPPEAGVPIAPEFEEVCSLADVFIVNFGLHFNQVPEIQSKRYIMNSVVACKRQFGAKVVIWRETLAQHFQYAGGNFRDRGTEFSYKVRQMHPSDGCSDLRFGDKKSEYNWRDRIFLEHARSLNVSIVETEWNVQSAKYKNISVPNDRIHWVLTHAPSEPLWAMHRSGWEHIFDEEMKSKTHDCTHFCYTPDVIFAPLIDGISLAFLYEKHHAWEPRRANLDDFSAKLSYCPSLPPEKEGM